MAVMPEKNEPIIIQLGMNNFPMIIDNYIKLGLAAVDMCKVTGSAVVIRQFTAQGDLSITAGNLAAFDRERFATMYGALLKAAFKAYLSPTTIKSDVNPLGEFKRTIGAVTLEDDA